MADETITITLTDEVARKLESLDISPEVNTKIKVRQLKQHQAELEADLAAVAKEIAALEKGSVGGDEVRR